MLINDVARKYDISTRTLRYYEELNLIKSQRNERNTRVYDQASIKRLEMILLFKHLNFSLSDIRAIFHEASPDLNKRLKSQLLNVDHAIMELKYKRTLIQSALKTYGSGDLSQATLQSFLEEQLFIRSNEERWLQMRDYKEIRLEIGEGLIPIAIEEAPLFLAIKTLRQELKEKHNIEMDKIRVRDMTDLAFEEIRILIGDDVIIRKEITGTQLDIQVDQIITHLKSVVI